MDHHPSWHAACARLVPSLGTGKASVAIARKLLVVVWHVLTHQAADRPADVALVTRKLPRWGKSRSVATQHGLSSGAFARQQLRRLGVDPSQEEGAGREPGGKTLPALAANGP